MVRNLYSHLPICSRWKGTRWEGAFLHANFAWYLFAETSAHLFAVLIPQDFGYLHAPPFTLRWQTLKLLVLPAFRALVSMIPMFYLLFSGLRGLGWNWILPKPLLQGLPLTSQHVSTVLFPLFYSTDIYLGFTRESLMVMCTIVSPFVCFFLNPLHVRSPYAFQIYTTSDADTCK